VLLLAIHLPKITREWNFVCATLTYRLCVGLYGNLLNSSNIKLILIQIKWKVWVITAQILNNRKHGNLLHSPPVIRQNNSIRNINKSYSEVQVHEHSSTLTEIILSWKFPQLYTFPFLISFTFPTFLIEFSSL
jgi:hypothetical protein